MLILKKKNGFSLIELIVVIAIIAVIFAIAIPLILSYLEKSKESVCLEDRKTAERMYSFYVANGGLYNPNNTTGTQFLVDAKLLKSNIVCKSGGVLTWGINDNGNAIIVCSVHGRPIGTETFMAFSNENVISVKGQWSIKDGKLVPTGPGENRMLIAGTTGKDYELIVNAKYNNTSGGGYGVYYRATQGTGADADKITGYCFQFDPGLGNRFAVRKVINGAEQAVFKYVDMKNVMGSDFDINAQHQISVNVNGDRQIIKVDGKVVLDFNDSTFTEGTAGLRSWAGTKVEFQDVKYNNDV